MSFGWVSALPWIPLAVGLTCCDAAREGAPRLGALSDATFQDQTDSKFSMQSLRGKPAIVNFIYTRCPDRCPLFSARFANLQKALGPADVHYISISVDPAHDTPPVLSTYAERYGARADQWRFLTGPLENVRADVLKAFRAHLEGREVQGNLDLMEIVHGELFVLLDATGTIRGFFGSDKPGRQRLTRALQGLGQSSQQG